MRDTDAEVRALAAEAARLAEITTDPRVRIAAGILAGKPPGRRKCNDADALAMARSTYESGLRTTIYGACNDAAKFYAEWHEVSNVRSRLIRKLKKSVVHN